MHPPQRDISLPVFLKSDILKTCCRVGCYGLSSVLRRTNAPDIAAIRNAIKTSTHLRNLIQDEHHAQAHLPTQSPPSQQGPRLPRSHGLQGRSRCPQPPPRQGPSQDRRLRRLPRLVALLRVLSNSALMGALPLSAFLCSARVSFVSSLNSRLPFHDLLNRAPPLQTRRLPARLQGWSQAVRQAARLLPRRSSSRSPVCHRGPAHWPHRTESSR